MREERLDGVLATSRENVYYGSGSDIGLPLRLAPVFLFRDDEPVFGVHANEAVKARKTSRITDIRVYDGGEWVPLAVWDFIADVFRERGLAEARIGLELLDVPGLAYDHIRTRLPRATFVDCGAIFDRLRAVKSEDELRWLREINRLTAQAITVAFERAHPGDTERQVTRRLIDQLLASGADGVAFLNLGTGRNTLEHHHVPDDTRLQPGDLVHVDVGGWWRGYASDISRMAVVGPPTDEQVRLHRVAVTAMRDTAEALRAGATVHDVHRAVQRSYAAQGVPYTRAFIGHSSGIGIHETPMLGAAHGDWVLEPGMFFQLEPDVATPDVRIHTEDAFIVHPHGAAENVSADRPVVDPQPIT
jgi:Xaa-Pro aminopeptidase